MVKKNQKEFVRSEQRRRNTTELLSFRGFDNRDYDDDDNNSNNDTNDDPHLPEIQYMTEDIQMIKRTFMSFHLEKRAL